MGDGKWPVKLLERDVATGMWRGRHSIGNICLLKH